MVELGRTSEIDPLLKHDDNDGGDEDDDFIRRNSAQSERRLWLATVLL